MKGEMEKERDRERVRGLIDSFNFHCECSMF